MTSGRLAIAVCVLLVWSLPATAQGEIGFDIDVTLSKMAAARLASQKEGLVAFASYYGDPKRSGGEAWQRDRPNQSHAPGRPPRLR